jgi:hypothetical protein
MLALSGFTLKRERPPTHLARSNHSHDTDTLSLRQCYAMTREERREERGERIGDRKAKGAMQQ